MAFLFHKFQEAVKVLAKSSTFARDPSRFQFESDINRLFLYTSYNRLGSGAEESDAEKLIELANKASIADQQMQVQENVHSQVKSFCSFMNEILLPDVDKKAEAPADSPASTDTQRGSGHTLAVGKSGTPSRNPAVPETRPLKVAEVSQRIKDLMGYTLVVKPSKIPHEEAGQGLFLDGKAEVGSVIAMYPGVVYSPSYYRYIPGYPEVGSQNPYLITRYDGTLINAQPWGLGGEGREMWSGSIIRPTDDIHSTQCEWEDSDKLWKRLKEPLPGKSGGGMLDFLERRNPLALAHLANHPSKGMEPNVMICPYDFPLTESDMRAYIPNIQFGDPEEAKMKRFGKFWFKLGSRVSNEPILKSIVLVATKGLCDEELLLDYRLINLKETPAWYTPVGEEELS